MYSYNAACNSRNPLNNRILNNARVDSKWFNIKAIQKGNEILGKKQFLTLETLYVNMRSFLKFNKVYLIYLKIFRLSQHREILKQTSFFIFIPKVALTVLVRVSASPKRGMGAISLWEKGLCNSCLNNSIYDLQTLT